MANSRMYLRHKSTGKKILLTKSMGNGFYLHHDVDTLDQWFHQVYEDLAGADESHYGDKFMFGALPLIEDQEPNSCPFELFME